MLLINQKYYQAAEILNLITMKYTLGTIWAWALQ